MVIKCLTMSKNEYRCAVKLSKFKIIYGVHVSPIGDCLIGIIPNQNAICYLGVFNGNLKRNYKEIISREWPGVILIEKQDIIIDVILKIFDNVKDNDTLVVLLIGSDFQIRVWQALISIPNGMAVTYTEIAESIGKPKAVRAVATAIANNRIGYLVPCHRVFRKNEVETNFRWGTERRYAMLNYEKKRLTCYAEI